MNIFRNGGARNNLVPLAHLGQINPGLNRCISPVERAQAASKVVKY